MSYNRQQSFFDNPKRYDSDEDLSSNRYASNSYTANNRYCHRLNIYFIIGVGAETDPTY